MNFKEIIIKNHILFTIATFVLNVKRKVVSKQIKGRNNVIKNAAISSNIKYEIYGDENVIIFASKLKITNNVIFVLGNNNKVVINDNGIYKSGSIWIEGNDNELRIGDSTTIENAHFLITGNRQFIEVGDDCLFSTNIIFRTGDSHSIIDVETNKRVNYEKSISVGNHVWIGADAKILKGVTIADNSIIGNGSIDIPSGVIAAGVPAHVLKTNVNWLRERI